jgi:hypothetical protein
MNILKEHNRYSTYILQVVDKYLIEFILLDHPQINVASHGTGSMIQRSNSKTLSGLICEYFRFLSLSLTFTFLFFCVRLYFFFSISILFSFSDKN